MGHGQYLRDLLAPLGVYRWEGSFQWSELQSEGEALDQVAQELRHIQQEMNLTTAQEEGLQEVLELLGRTAGDESLEDLRQTAAALLRMGDNSFTLAAMNDAIRGCGIAAQVAETGDPLKVAVTFPGVVGIPGGFFWMQKIIEAILPCHLQVQYQFAQE